MIRENYLSVFLLLIFLGSSCVYTTHIDLYPEKSIYIAPVVNKISISEENRSYNNYRSYPLLIEKKLTSAIAEKFSQDGNLRVSSEKNNSLMLYTEIIDYVKESLRYNDNDEIKEQKLKLKVKIKLLNSRGEKVKEQEILGETDYFLSGPYQKTESSAQQELINDTARRIVESIVENW